MVGHCGDVKIEFFDPAHLLAILAVRPARQCEYLKPDLETRHIAPVGSFCISGGKFSIGSGNRRHQFGSSSLPGWFGCCVFAQMSSSESSRSRAGDDTSTRCTSSIACAVAVVEVSVCNLRCSGVSIALSMTPAMVGRSWVVTVARHISGHREGGSCSNHTTRVPAMCARQVRRDIRLDRPEILANHENSRPHSFEAQNREQFVRWKLDVCAVWESPRQAPKTGGRDRECDRFGSPRHRACTLSPSR